MASRSYLFLDGRRCLHGVMLGLLWPHLDALLGLEQRLHRKIKQAAASVGVTDEIIPGSQIEEHVFTEAREEIEQLRSQDATIFERGGEIRTAHSGEEYRQELRQAFEDRGLADDVKSLA